MARIELAPEVTENFDRILDDEIDTVFVLALRSQREAGHARP